MRRWFWLLLIATVVFFTALIVVSDRLPIPGGGDEVLLGEPVPHGPPADATPP